MLSSVPSLDTGAHIFSAGGRVLSTRRSIVGVFAHPDDEALLAGGTLARCVAAGASAAIVTCTGGEAGDSWDPRIDPAHIARVRREELQEACVRLGIGDVTILDYRDSGIPARGDRRSLVAAPLEQVAERIAGALATRAPDVVITHDPTGGYGHPDHVRVSEATALAIRRLDPPPLLYHAVTPRRVVDAFQRAFAAAGVRAGRAAATGADMDRDAGVPDEAVTATIDVSAFVRVKRDAVRAHRTQMTGHVLFRLPWPVLAELWGEEHFALGGGAKPRGLTGELFPG